MASIGPASSGSPARRLARVVGHSLRDVQVLALRGKLDAELAAGIDPSRDPALALRADQLTRPRYRRRIAASVQHLVDDADSDRGWWLSAAIPFLRDQASEARGTLLSLAGALRDVEAVDPRGVAMTLRLITDPASPLYARTARGALQLRAHAALRCLLADSQPWCELPDGLRIEGSSGDR